MPDLREFVRFGRKIVAVGRNYRFVAYTLHCKVEHGDPCIQA